MGRLGSFFAGAVVGAVLVVLWFAGRAAARAAQNPRREWARHPQRELEYWR